MRIGSKYRQVLYFISKTTAQVIAGPFSPAPSHRHNVHDKVCSCYVWLHPHSWWCIGKCLARNWSMWLFVSWSQAPFLFLHIWCALKHLIKPHLESHRSVALLATTVGVSQMFVFNVKPHLESHGNVDLLETTVGVSQMFALNVKPHIESHGNVALLATKEGVSQVFALNVSSSCMSCSST